jgi:hypothetical protein
MRIAEYYTFCFIIFEIFTSIALAAGSDIFCAPLAVTCPRKTLFRDRTTEHSPPA